MSHLSGFPLKFINNKFIRQMLDFLLFSNLFIALCTVAQALVTYRLLNAQPHAYVLGLLLCSTIAMYNYSMLLSKPRNPDKSPFLRVRWIFSHYRLTITITIIAILSLLPLAMFLSTESKILLFFVGLISIGYNLPIFTLNDKKFGLRNIPGIKLILIAMVWSLSVVLLPILELESNQHILVPARDIILLIAKRFLFVAAITVPFDIRDLFQDRNNELKTIPVMLGEKKAYFFCMGLLAIYLVLLFLFTKSFDRNFFGLMTTIILAGWLIFRSEWERNEYYYFFYLDGVMLMQYVVLLTVNSVFL
jgi:4-hydroxybenzoate polyprenyltransferase